MEASLIHTVWPKVYGHTFWTRVFHSLGCVLVFVFFVSSSQFKKLYYFQRSIRLQFQMHIKLFFPHIWCGRTWLLCTDPWPKPLPTPSGWTETQAGSRAVMMENNHDFLLYHSTIILDFIWEITFYASRYFRYYSYCINHLTKQRFSLFKLLISFFFEWLIVLKPKQIKLSNISQKSKV